MKLFVRMPVVSYSPKPVIFTRHTLFWLKTYNNQALCFERFLLNNFSKLY
jgi:hypothetical protein